MTVSGSQAHALRAGLGSKRAILVGSVRTTVRPGKKTKLHIALDRAGKRLLAAHHTLQVTIIVSQRLPGGGLKRLLQRRLTFHSRWRG
jgi:hypothetical protein